MSSVFWIITAIYLVFINLFAVIITAYDKSQAKHHKWRVKEATLMTVAVLGGSVAMYATMQVIRHKTKHPKFMVGIPIIIVLHVAAVGLFFYFRFIG